MLTVSVDLDELELYRAIHGLAPSRTPARVVYERAVPRALAFASELGVPLTFFAVSRDLEDPESARRLRDALARGHAVESHSATHPYDLVRRSDAEIDREVGGSFDAIGRALGVRPRGFRAPGYTTSERVLDALERAGAAFDASVFPCPSYWAAKAAILGALSLAGRPSRSIVGSPAVLLAPRRPYRPGRTPHARGDRRFVEVPVQVTRGARLPLIGTSLGWAGERGARWLVRACEPTPVLGISLHGVDFLDRDDVPPDVRDLPELRVPLARRLRALSAAVAACGSRRPVTLAEAAEALATSPCT